MVMDAIRVNYADGDTLHEVGAVSFDTAIE